MVLGAIAAGPADILASREIPLLVTGRRGGDVSVLIGCLIPLLRWYPSWRML